MCLDSTQSFTDWTARPSLHKLNSNRGVSKVKVASEGRGHDGVSQTTARWRDPPRCRPVDLLLWGQTNKTSMEPKRQENLFRLAWLSFVPPKPELGYTHTHTRRRLSWFGFLEAPSDLSSRSPTSRAITVIIASTLPRPAVI